MGTHPIFESDFDCLTEMLGLYGNLILLLCFFARDIEVSSTTAATTTATTAATTTSTNSPTKKPTTKVFPAVNPVDKCTLKAAIEVSIGGKKYCANSLGESTYSTAEAKCRSRNAKLPMPRSSQENSDFLYVLSKMGLNPHYDTGNPVILGMMDSA